MKPLAVLLVTIAGFGVMFRLVSLRVALVSILVAGVLSVFGPQLLHAALELPAWVLVLGGAWVGLALLRVVARLLLGEEAANSMAGELAAGLVRLTLQIVLLPVRAIRAIARRIGLWEL